MSVCRIVGRLVLPLLLLVPSVLSGQEESPGRLRVYLECSSCDFSYVRTEITWVDWVRDRQDSDVHILVTTQSTGAGGREYTMEFIGRNRFASKLDTLVWRSTRDDTSDLIRQGLTQVLKMGLMPYLVGTPAERALRIGLAPPPPGGGRPGGPPPGLGETKDPWDFWVFSISVSGYVQGESQQKYGSYNSSLSANRTTEEWKINSSARVSYSESVLEIDPATEITAIRRSYSASLLAVKSLGPKLSVGLNGSYSSSTYGNIKLGVRLSPAIEYDLFPYAESTRRIFTLRYTLGLAKYDYREVTVFDELHETRPVHTFEAGYTVRQPWGSASFGLDYAQFLHDTDKWHYSANASTSIRLIRGLSFNLFGAYGKVRDQLSLAREGATRDEVLLRLKQLRTNYTYFFNFGLSYRFGSSLNNVVNPRMSGAGSSEVMIIM